MRRSNVCAALVFVGVTALSYGAASPACADDKPAVAPVTIDSLMARFRAMPGLFARFHEEKRIGLLVKPLVSDGTIHFAPRSRLARHTLTPAPASVILDGATLRFGNGATSESMDLGASPVVRSFVSSFLQLLAGERASLEKIWVIELKPGAGETWQLVLRPKADTLLAILKEISFAGDGAIVQRMRLVEASGDESTTTFRDVDVKHTYGADEAAQVCRLPK